MIVFVLGQNHLVSGWEIRYRDEWRITRDMGEVKLCPVAASSLSSAISYCWTCGKIWFKVHTLWILNSFMPSLHNVLLSSVSTYIGSRFVELIDSSTKYVSQRLLVRLICGVVLLRRLRGGVDVVSGVVHWVRAIGNEIWGLFFELVRRRSKFRHDWLKMMWCCGVVFVDSAFCVLKITFSVECICCAWSCCMLLMPCVDGEASKMPSMPVWIGIVALSLFKPSSCGSDNEVVSYWCLLHLASDVVSLLPLTVVSASSECSVEAKLWSYEFSLELPLVLLP